MRRSLILIALFLVGGCNLTKFAYNRGEWLIGREVRKYSCPNAQQRKHLKRIVRSAMVWHRTQELPKYVTLMRQVATLLLGPVSRKAYDEIYAKLEKAWLRSSKQIAGPFADYALTFKEPQIRCLVKKMESRRAESKKAIVKSHAEYYKIKVEAAVKLYGKLVDTITPKQRIELAANLSTRDEAWDIYKARGRAIARLEKLVRSRNRTEIVHAIATPYAVHDSAGRKVMAKASKRFKERTWQLVSRLTEAQRRYFRKRVLIFAQDFDILSREKP